MHLKEESFFIPGPVGPLEVKALGFVPEPAQNNAQNKNHPLLAVICHPHPLYQGSMDNKIVTTLARAFRALNIPSLRFNFRGVGKSAGSYAEGQGEQEDLIAVLNWALAENPNLKFCLAGFSFGAYITAMVAAKEDFPVEFLINIAPPVQYFTFPNHILPKCPWLIIQGDEDEVVPFDLVQTWYQNLKKEKEDLNLKIFKGAGHYFHGRLVELQHLLIDSLGHLNQ